MTFVTLSLRPGFISDAFFLSVLSYLWSHLYYTDNAGRMLEDARSTRSIDRFQDFHDTAYGISNHCLKQNILGSNDN